MSSFEWDNAKNSENIKKHGISFELAQRAFLDSKRIVAQDLEHSAGEGRYFLFGKL
jgi:uncharacterized DUF497 family protein